MKYKFCILSKDSYTLLYYWSRLFSNFSTYTHMNWLEEPSLSFTRVLQFDVSLFYCLENVINELNLRLCCLLADKGLLCAAYLFWIRSLYFSGPLITLCCRKDCYSFIYFLQSHKKACWTQSSPCLTVPFCPHLCLSVSLLFFLTSSTLAFLTWPQGAWRRNQNSVWFVAFSETVGRQHGMCPRDVYTFSLSWIWNNQRRHSSIQLREQKPGAKYIFWFYGCTNLQSLMERNLEGEEDGQIALGSLLDYF